MDADPRRRNFIRLFGGALAGATTLGAVQGCDDDAQTGTGSTPSASAETVNSPQAVPSATSSMPMATFPPGSTSSGTNIPTLAEGGRLRLGGPRHSLEVVWNLDIKQQLVALTFDDGPSADVSTFLYDVLDETKTRATFFMVGTRVLRNAKLVHGRMDRHEVGNHTNSHESLFMKSDTETLDDLTAAHRAISGVIGREPTMLRPPYGHVNGNTLVAAAAMGYDIVMWNNFIGDAAYENDEEKLVEDVVGAAKPGSVYLGHDAGEPRLIAIRNLPKIISELRRRNYELVTISELRAAAK